MSGSVAIVDYGMGNLFSVQQACEHVGLRPVVTSSRREIELSEAVILPGVGAFGDAMNNLEKLDLVAPLREMATSEKPLLGICLGMQLLMSGSHEFGKRSGLGIIEGEAVRLETSVDRSTPVKVPQVGWNRITASGSEQHKNDTRAEDPEWNSPVLNGIPNGEYMYFVHSFYARPADEAVVVSTTQYGPNKFCSSLSSGNVFGCQFHPERSGPAGLKVYRNLARLISTEVASSSR